MTTKKRTKAPTPIIDAVLSRDVARIRAGIEAGGSVNERDKDGRSPLHHACIQNDDHIVELLLMAGADATSADGDGMTPLHFAARRYEVSIAKKLLQSGALVDARDSNGNTPLSDAVFESKGRGELIVLLLNAGADRNRENDHGVSPAALAASIANYDVKQWLKR